MSSAPAKKIFRPKHGGASRHPGLDPESRVFNWLIVHHTEINDAGLQLINGVAGARDCALDAGDAG